MKNLLFRILASFAVSVVASFLIAVIVSIFIVEPEVIVNKLSVIFHTVPGSAVMTANYFFYSKKWGEAILIFFIGSLGGILGWFAFRGFYMYIVNLAM